MPANNTHSRKKFQITKNEFENRIESHFSGNHIQLNCFTLDRSLLVNFRGNKYV